MRFLSGPPCAPAEEVDKQIYEVGRRHYDKPGKIFPLLYKVLLGQKQGPRLGVFIKLATPQRILTLLHQSAHSARVRTRSPQKGGRPCPSFCGGDAALMSCSLYEKESGNGNRTQPYTFLGPVRYLSHSGERPMSIVWELQQEMPARFFFRSKIGGGMKAVSSRLGKKDRPQPATRDYTFSTYDLILST